MCAHCYLFSPKSQLAHQNMLCGRQVPAGVALNMGCLPPCQCLGERASAVCETEDGYRAGGRGCQLLERRELYGRVRNKINSVSGARVTGSKKTTLILSFISLL